MKSKDWMSGDPPPLTEGLLNLAQMVASGPILEMGKLGLKAFIFGKSTDPDILTIAQLL